jgi:hypothetical protein
LNNNQLVATIEHRPNSVYIAVIKGKDRNTWSYLKVIFLHSSPGFGTMNQIKGLAQRWVNLLFFGGGLVNVLVNTFQIAFKSVNGIPRVGLVNGIVA